MNIDFATLKGKTLTRVENDCGRVDFETDDGHTYRMEGVDD